MCRCVRRHLRELELADAFKRRIEKQVLERFIARGDLHRRLCPDSLQRLWARGSAGLNLKVGRYILPHWNLCCPALVFISEFES